MLLILPLACALIFYIIKNDKNKFQSFLISICLTFSYLYVATEVLSLFKLISEVSIKISWSLFLACLLFISIIKFTKNRNKKENIKKIQLKDIVKKVRFPYVIAILFIVTMLYISIKTTPYNWDSMTYHIPRIIQWIQNGNINHYATNIIRQIASPIFAEITDMHIYLLSDSNDMFLNVLQTVSYIINAIIVYFIARKIGCNKNFAILAMILVISMPIAFAEALSTQVDNFAALWCLIFTYLILDYLNKNEKIKIDKDNIIKLICLGLCLGFGFLTKPTILFSNALFTIYLLFMCIRRKDKIKEVIISILIVGITTTIIILPSTLRNIKTFNAISNPITGEKQIIQVDRKSYFLVNFLKNLLWNYQATFIDNNDEIIKEGLENISSTLDVSFNDESISEGGIDYNIRNDLIYHHDYAVNPLIMWSLTISIILYIIGFRNNKEKKSIMYCIISILSFIIFISIMRFQVWETRYEISFLALLCPAISLLLNQGLKEKYQKYLIGAICSIALISMINQFGYHVKFIEQLPSKSEEYFRSNDGRYNFYYEICNIINDGHYKNIGLDVSEDTYEYPLQVMIKEKVNIKHVNVQNSSNIYYDDSYIPDVVISNISDENSINDYERIYNNKNYIKIYSIDKYNIYKLNEEI